MRRAWPPTVAAILVAAGAAIQFPQLALASSRPEVSALEQQLQSLVCALRRPEVPIPALNQIKPSELRRTLSLRDQLFSELKSRFKPAEHQEFARWYGGNLFYDRNERLLDSLAGRAGLQDVLKRYDRGQSQPLNGYLRASRTWKQRRPGKLALDDILSLHELMMRDLKTARFGTDAIGKIRQREIVISGNLEEEIAAASRIERLTGKNQPLKYPFGSLEKALAINPLLARFDSPDELSLAPLIEWKKHQDHLKPASRKKLQILEKTRPDLMQETDLSHPEYREAIRVYVTDLLEDAISKLNRGLASAPNLTARLKTIANFQHRFLSIHPFLDGNGRVARFLTEKQVESLGLPPPLWTHWEFDFLLDPRDFSDLLQDSIALSHRFHRELDAMARAGLDYRMTPVVFADPAAKLPGHAPAVPEEFITWVKENQGLDVEGPLQAYGSFLNWRAKYDYSPIDKSPGVRLSTPLFEATYAKPSRSKELFKMKMREFYEETPVYRGMLLYYRPRTRDIARMFFFADEATLGMGITPATAAGLIPRQLKIFNQELVNDPKQLVKRIKAHSGTTYDQNYFKGGFVSYSYRPEIAEAYERGILMSLDEIADGKTSLRITARARKVASIDTGLDTLFFRSPAKFPSEEEHLLVGGTDPESITEIVLREVPPGQPAYWKSIPTYIMPAQHREFTRVAHDTVRVITVNEDGHTIKREFFHLSKDGKLRDGKPPQ